MHPYRMDPSEEAIKKAVSETQDAYKPLPETTCDHLNCCCNAGCPNMYYAEFLSIRRSYVDAMPADKRQELTLECVRRYLINQADVVRGATKPCVFLGADKMCGVYGSRPLKCRLYGLIPPGLYKWIVGEVSKDSGIPKENIPLCVQCDRVKVKPEYQNSFPSNVIPEAMIRDLEKRLRANDVALGLPRDIQTKGFGFLTYHDWHLMFELGESCMATLSALRSGLTDEQKEQFLEVLKHQLEARDEPQGAEEK